MARILFALSFLLFVVILLACVVFVLRNDALVAVDLLFVEFTSLSVGFWVLGSLVVGLILGFLFSVPTQIFLFGSKKIKDKRLQTTETKLSRLKRATSKG